MDSNTRRFDRQDAPPMIGQVTTAPRPDTAPLTRRDSRAVLEPTIRRNSNLIGFGLIALGVVLFLGRAHLAAALGACVPLVIGSVFLYVYADKGRNIGFLIPGAILAGLGLGGFVGMLIGLPGLFALGMGLGFAAIWYLHREHWWALIPGGILAVTGLTTVLPGHGGSWLLPTLLVLGGLWLLTRHRRATARQ